MMIKNFTLTMNIEIYNYFVEVILKFIYVENFLFLASYGDILKPLWLLTK